MTRIPTSPKNYLHLLFLLVMASALFHLPLISATAADSGASVVTDTEDYPPYSIVWITGTGFSPGETVSNVVVQIAGPAPGTIYDGWEVVADVNGDFETEWLVFSDELVGTTLELTSTGQTSGLIAQVQFKDSIGVPSSIGTFTSESSGTSSQIANVSAGQGNTIVIVLAMNPSSGAVSVTDTKGNTYTQDKDVTNGSGTAGVRTLVFSARVTTALSSGAGDDINISHPTVTARAAYALLVSGLVASSPVDQTASATGTSTSPSVGPTATTTQADEIILGAFGYEDGGSFTPGSGYTGFA